MVTKARAPACRGVYGLLVRQISANVKDQRSALLNRLMVDLSSKYADTWLFSEAQNAETPFSSLIFIKFLRLIEEHYLPEFLQLRQKEIQVCLKIWNGNQEECYQIGREFLRIFINICHHIPEFQKICNDL